MGRPETRLRLESGQQDITAEQLAEAARFISEHVGAQLSGEPVDEAAAEELLRQAYVAARVPPPHHIHWLDGPLELVALLTATRDAGWLTVADEYRERVPHCAWDDATLDRNEIALLDHHVDTSLDYRIRKVRTLADRHVDASFGATTRDGVPQAIWRRVWDIIWDPLRFWVGDRLWREVGAAAGWPFSADEWTYDMFGADFSLWHSISAYIWAPWLIVLHYFDTYLAPNQAGPLARFNELVSGYWLGKSVAFVVRKPRVLSRDERGRLHSPSGPAVEYPDGWGFWAWHGMRVPERAITTPAEQLTREDFLHEPNLEVRRVIQERMGERFLWELGVRFVDGGPRGILYEVDLPNDPERVARYVQVTDPSTGRVYYLRVPRGVASAEEAVAWTFGLSADEYHPSRES